MVMVMVMAAVLELVGASFPCLSHPDAPVVPQRPFSPTVEDQNLHQLLVVRHSQLLGLPHPFPLLERWP
jgi:hypothetical protein